MVRVVCPKSRFSLVLNTSASTSEICKCSVVTYRYYFFGPTCEIFALHELGCKPLCNQNLYHVTCPAWLTLLGVITSCWQLPESLWNISSAATSRHEPYTTDNINRTSDIVVKNVTSWSRLFWSVLLLSQLVISVVCPEALALVRHIFHVGFITRRRENVKLLSMADAMGMPTTLRPQRSVKRLVRVRAISISVLFYAAYYLWDTCRYSITQK